MLIKICRNKLYVKNKFLARLIQVIEKKPFTRLELVIYKDNYGYPFAAKFNYCYI